MGLCGGKATTVDPQAGSKEVANEADAAGGNEHLQIDNGGLAKFKGKEMTEKDWAAQSDLAKKDGGEARPPSKTFLKKGEGAGAAARAAGSSRVENDLVLESVDPSSPRCRVDKTASAASSEKKHDFREKRLSFREQLKADRAKAAQAKKAGGGASDDVEITVVTPDKKKQPANRAQSQPELGGVVESPKNKVRVVQSDGMVTTDYV